MKLIVDNINTTAVVGGKDNLLEFDVMRELREYLKLRAHNYHRTQAYEEGRWDGYVHYITKGGKFATGFLPLVANYLTELGVTIEVQDDRTNLPVLKKDMTSLIGEIDGTIWEATVENKRHYQLQQVQTLNNYITVGDQELYFPRGIMDSATNAGKNSIAALLLNNLAEKYPTVFMVSNEIIFKQAVDFFTQVIGEPVGQIKSSKLDPKWFTVCMVKTLYNRASKNTTIRSWLHNEIKVLIVDESDESGAKEYSKTLKFIGAGMRVFVSGTPLEASAENNMLSIGLSGPVLSKITNKELIEKGHSQKPIVRILLNNTKPLLNSSYVEEKFRGIHTSIIRVKLILGILKDHAGKDVLITFIEKTHGYFMYNYLKEALPSINMGIAHGTDKKAVASFKKKEISVLFSSMIIKRGANIPNIEVLVMGQGGKSTITVKQITGRGMRHDGVSDEFYLYDFYDIGRYLGKHSRDRIRVYQNEEFEVEKKYRDRRGIPVL